MIMSKPWQVFEVTPELRASLIRRLKTKERIFSIESDPLFASLCACLGLQFEVGKPALDRLSPYLGVTGSAESGAQWQSEIITHGDDIGIRMWVPGIAEFRPRHKDFAEVLHPFSIGPDGLLSQIVIFPRQVANRYKAKGFELVIVRDWLLSSSLSEGESGALNYLLVNNWEIENNTAIDQAQLMANGQIAFSGSHDIVDHLLGGNRERFDLQRTGFLEVREKFARVFDGKRAPRSMDLLLSYAIGVLLDDLAQPRWYGSERHARLLRSAAQLLGDERFCPGDVRRLELPVTFHQMIEKLRDGSCDSVDGLFNAFALDLQAMSARPVPEAPSQGLRPAPGLRFARAE